MPSRHLGPAIRLVEKPSDLELIEQLEGLLAEARLGKVVGLLMAAHHGGSEYTYSGAGSFCRQPHLAAGALRQLSERFFP